MTVYVALLRGVNVGGKNMVKMADIKVGDKFRCSVCGNVVVLTKAGGGTLMCCSKSMERITK